MSYLVLPNKIHTDSIMCNSEPILNGIWEDIGLVAYYAAPIQKWVVILRSDNGWPWDCAINFGGSHFSPRAPIFDSPAWTGTEGTLCRSYVGQWVVVPNDWAGGIVTPTVEYSWWAGGSGSSPHEMVFTGKGAAAGDNRTTDISTWKRWESDSPIGVYTNAGGATGTRVVGTPQYTDGDGKIYTKIINNVWAYYPPPCNYGDAKYVAGTGWVIGTRNDATGWWVSATEPNVSSPTTFTFTVPVGSEVTGDPIVLTFSQYVLGIRTMELLLGEAAIWRP